MGDIADVSDDGIARAVQAGIEQVRRAHNLRADGCCHFCDEVAAPEALFCNADCRDDYEHEQAALRRAGRI